MDSEKQKALESAGWRFGDVDDFFEMTGEKLATVKKRGCLMLRLALILTVPPICLLAGILGAMAGMCVELSWPLSGRNLTYAICWGIGVGILGLALTTLSLVVAQRKSPWWIIIIGVGITILLGFLSMWWDVVRSLG